MERKILLQRRHTMESHWSSFLTGSSIPKTASISNHIVSSWRRSAEQLNLQKAHAPADDECVVAQRWQQSPISSAFQCEQNNLIQLADEGEMVVAIADAAGQLLWTHASGHMKARAESVNFTVGGYWNEGAVGTNAIGLSQKLREPVTVFSSEHYQQFVHDWVCYASPIISPVSGKCLGFLDISTTWTKHSPLGQSAVTQLACSIAQQLPKEMPKAELEIYAMGQPSIVFQGVPLKTSPRQVEILSLLALNSDGLNLEFLHATLYGDNPVSTNTLKAELSLLRRLLDGKIGSRPYRLLMPVWADFIQIWKYLYTNNCRDAFSLYRGPLLPKSTSPELEEWRHCIDAVMSKSINACDNPTPLLEQLCDVSSGNVLVRERLVELL